jgi:peroxiredoxin
MPERSEAAETNTESLLWRVKQVSPYLSMAIILIAVALIVTRPWEDDSLADSGGMGVIPLPEGRSVPADRVLPYPDHVAPNFRLASLSGETMELGAFDGRPVFVNFWATWCFTCVTEMPAIQRVFEAYGDEIVVLGVNVGERPADARTFAENNEITYDLLLDSDQSVTRAYLVQAMPASFVIRPDGVVDTAWYGPITEAEIWGLIDPLLVAGTSS